MSINQTFNSYYLENEKKKKSDFYIIRMRMRLDNIFDIIWRKAEQKAKNGDFNTEEEFRTYIYEHELPFVEAEEKEGWTKENGKRVYYGPDGEKY